MLALIHASAAEKNDKVGLFKSRQRFPEVFERRAAVEDCEAALSGLLPQLAKALRVPRLEYKSLQNQGDFLIEVDSTRTDIPKVVCALSLSISASVPGWFTRCGRLIQGSFLVQDWEKIAGTKKVNRFRPPAVRDAVQELELARERLQATADRTYQDFLGSFASLYLSFRSAASALAALDALQSLALVACNSECGTLTRAVPLLEHPPAQKPDQMHSGNLRRFQAAILHLRPGPSHGLTVSEDGSLYTLT